MNIIPFMQVTDVRSALCADKIIFSTAFDDYIFGIKQDNEATLIFLYQEYPCLILELKNLALWEKFLRPKLMILPHLVKKLVRNESIKGSENMSKLKKITNIMKINYVEEVQDALNVIGKLTYDNYTFTVFPENNQCFLALRSHDEPVMGFKLRSPSLWEDRMYEVVHGHALPRHVYFLFKESIARDQREEQVEPEPIDFEEKYFSLVKKLTKQNLTSDKIDEIIGSLEPVPNEWIEHDY